MDFLCLCGSNFKSKSAFYRHRRKCSSCSAKKDTYICYEDGCSFKADSSGKFLIHLNDDHKIVSEEMTVEFNDYKDFLIWKEYFEKETKAFFKTTWKNKTSVGRTEFFECNRSGNYSVKQERIRAVKSQGIRKIGFRCPAAMKAIVDERMNRVKVIVQSLHYGHDLELAHLPLPNSDKNMIACQLSMGVPRSRVKRNMFSTTDVERRHLVTNSDLCNIARIYGIAPARPSDDSVVQECEEDIVLYKEQGKEGQSIPFRESSELGKNDFALGVMTKFQQAMFEKFGSNIVCLDAATQNDFNLITVMVSDEFGEGTPVGFLLSNRENTSVLTRFFEEIKKRVSACPTFSIMSDKVPQFCNRCWEQVFQSQKLPSSWHQEDFSRKLTKDWKTQEMVHRDLCTILEEQEEERFEKLLKNFLEQLRENPLTAEFFNHFGAEGWTQWARCYRIASGINTNTFSEAAGKISKCSDGYFKSKRGNRVERCLSILIRVSQDLAAKRLDKLEKGKTSWKVGEIIKRHKEAVILPKTLVKKSTDTMWLVDSVRSFTSETPVYIVTKQPDCKQECTINCQPCGICLHSYLCNCPDGLLATSICKHIHQVVLSQKEGENTLGNPSSDSFIISGLENTEPGLKNAFVTKSHNREQQENIELLKSDLIKKHQELLEMIKNCNNRDALVATNYHIDRACYGIKMFNDAVPTGTAGVPMKIKKVTASNKTKGKEQKPQQKKLRLLYPKPTYEQKFIIIHNVLPNTNTTETEDHTYSSIENNLTPIQQQEVSNFLQCFISPDKVTDVMQSKSKAEETDVETVPGKVSDAVIDLASEEILKTIPMFVTDEACLIINQILSLKRKEWSCSSCTLVSTKENMIYCVYCKNWYHWKCQDVKDMPDDSGWKCLNCTRTS